MTIHWGNPHKFIDLLREGDPTATVSVKKPDGTHLNIAPLSTLLREWAEMEAHIAKLEELFVPVGNRKAIKHIAIEDMRPNDPTAQS